MPYARFPFQADARGRTAESAPGDHLRELIEQVLFTSPGERVNRPDFGAGLLRMVFEPGSDAVTAPVRMTVQGALQTWLGDRIQVRDVAVESDAATLRVTVRYLELPRRTARVAVFSREL